MTTDAPFTAPAGRPADAVEFLVANSALAHLVTTDRHASGALHVTAPPYASTGEALLWALAKSIGDAPGIPPTVFDLADRLDGPNLAAAYAAIGLAFGMALAPVGVRA